MEGEEQRRRQHEHSTFPRATVPASPVHPDIATGTGRPNIVQDLNSGRRYRQARFITSPPPTSAATSVNPNTQHMTNFGSFPTTQTYASTQLQGQGVPFQYQSEYTQDPQRQQAFPQQYTPQLMYSTQQAPQQSPYDPVAQYQSRQSVSSEILPNQFGDAQFFNSGASGNTSVSTSVPPQFPTASFQQNAQYGPQADVERPPIASQYPETQSDFTQPATPTVADPNQGQVDRYEVFYNQYRQALRETNENASRGRLVEAGESLLEISQWLLGNVEGLELTKDNQAIHQDRLKLWKDFNYCWLAFLTRQLDDSKRLQATGRRPSPGQSVLSKAALQHLGDELTRLCDGLEKSGLVDYEMGVWEEEIIHCNIASLKFIRLLLMVIQCFCNAGTLRAQALKTQAKEYRLTDHNLTLEITKDDSRIGQPFKLTRMAATLPHFGRSRKAVVDFRIEHPQQSSPD